MGDKMSNSPRNLLKDVMAAGERKAMLGIPKPWGLTHREGCCHPLPLTSPAALPGHQTRLQGRARAAEPKGVAIQALSIALVSVPALLGGVWRNLDCQVPRVLSYTPYVPEK